MTRNSNRLIIGISLLNFIDVVLTAIGLKIGYVWEVNPLMRYVWYNSPFLFVGIKVFFSVLVIVVCFNLYSKLLYKIYWITFIVYSLIFLQHIRVILQATYYF